MEAPRTLLERMLASGAWPASTTQGVDTTASEQPILPTEFEALTRDSSVHFVDIDAIDIESQIRTTFDENHIADLALDFIASGLMQPKQPITLYRRGGGRFLLDAGENRLRAMRYADTHRDVLGITDPAAFKHIRATVLGDEPNKLDRLQSQARENLLRAELNDVDLGLAVRAFQQANPTASQTDAARWVGFNNLASGRVRVHNALKLLSCDDDLIGAVRSGELAASRALVLQTQRKESADNTQTAASKSDKKSSSLPVDVDSLKIVSEILLAVAASLGIELPEGQGDLDRKGIAALLNAPALRELLVRVKA